MFDKDKLLNLILLVILIGAIAMVATSCASKKVMKDCTEAQGGLFVCEEI